VNGALPIALFIDRTFAPDAFAAALAGEVAVREEVSESERGLVAALVTASRPVGAAEIALYPRLRLVLTCSTGVDHLDLVQLRERGLIAAHTPTYCSDEVADHALACVLGAWRGLWRLGDDTRAGGWDEGAMLRRFDAQRLGIIGLGRIGTRLAHRARALGIDVVGHDPVAAPPDIPAVGLDELLATADAISVHVPGALGASPLLGAAQIAAMKPGAALINVSRASLVDLDAVVGALRSGALSAAAWDVWPQEPPAAGDPRLQTPGLLVTPHIAWSSPEADAAGIREGVEALRDVLVHGRPPATVVS
jgi:phosphoglycerate dehydrogenase-like enzyme